MSIGAYPESSDPDSSAPETGPTSADPQDWEAARRRWRDGAARLWSGALADPETYEHIGRSVSTVVEELRRVAAHPVDLLATDRAGTLAAELLPAATVARAGGQRLVLTAACAVRADELAGEQARADRRARIARARDEGAGWVRLEDTGTRTVELHLASGRTLVGTVDPLLADVYGAGPYRIAELVLDVATGEVVTGDSPGGGDGRAQEAGGVAGDVGGAHGGGASFSSAEGWQRDWQRRRDEIAEHPDAADPAPVDPGPVDPGPVDPGPVDPGPVDPGPVDPGPVDPASTGRLDSTIRDESDDERTSSKVNERRGSA